MASMELMQGTLDLLVLKTLMAGPMHGYSIARAIRETSGEVFLVREGSLYPALYRIERRGWIRASWGVSENGRRARYYRITPAAVRELEREEADWKRYAGAVARVLATVARGTV